jgi:FkbM family methyltransferase
MREAISNSAIWNVLRDTPIGTFMKKSYWYYKLNLETTTTSVGNYRAEFLTNSQSEYSRVKNFVGEARVLEEILDRLEGDEQYWDVGANIGTHSVFPAKKLTNGHVTVFEPMPAVNERLKTNLNKNVPTERWTVEQVGLYSENGQRAMKIGSEDPGSGTHSISDKGDVKIELQRADHYIQADNIPDVVKIDVEGTELEVLRDFGDYLSDVNLLVIEVHPTELEKYGGTEEQVLDCLDAAGFEIREQIKRDPSGDTYHAIAES